MRQISPPPLPNFPPGHPSEALPERVRNRRFGRLWRTRVSCARRHLWNDDGPLGELGGARVSLHKLSREPLRVSHNVEFSPLPTPPGVRTPRTSFRFAPGLTCVRMESFGPAVWALLRTSLPERELLGPIRGGCRHVLGPLRPPT